MGYALIFSMVCFLGAALGASVVFFIKKDSNNIDAFLYAFSAGVMLASAIFSLIIPSLGYIQTYNVNSAIIFPLCFAVVGCLYFILNYKSKKNLNNNTFAIMLGVGLHNVPEGICVGASFAMATIQNSSEAIMSAILISIGIAIQNIPEGTSIAFPLYCKGISKLRSFLYSILVASIEVVSCIIFYFVGSSNFILLPFTLVFAGAIMIIIVACDLMPEAIIKNKNMSIIWFILGFVIMMLLGLIID